MPWAIRTKDMQTDLGQQPLIAGFKDAPEQQPIPLEDLEREYCRLTHQPYPITEMVFASSWMLFRVCNSRAAALMY
jgi:hypothetical protein